MKILVTGGAGFIGSHVVVRYIKEGHTVVVVDNLTTGNKQNLHSKTLFYDCDIASPQLLEIFKKEKPDVVNHHAAQMNVRHSLEDPLYDAQVNILGTINVLSCCVKMHVKRFLFISSGGAIYGPAPIPTHETYPPSPLSPYGLSKYVGEQYVQLYSQLYGLSYVILRYANVYGSRQNPKSEAGVIAIFIDKMKRGEEPIIFGDGNQTRDYIYVKDIVQANVLALTKGKNQIINLGTGKETSVNTLFSLLKKEMCFQKKALYGEEIIGEIRAGALDITRAQKILDWQPPYSLESGLHKTVEDNTMGG
jgi:UDP-glucose 4-epimerase